MLVAHGCTALDSWSTTSSTARSRSILSIASHHDVEPFFEAMARADAQPLSSLTEGVHLHHVRAPGSVALESARQDLALLGYLLED